MNDRAFTVLLYLCLNSNVVSTSAELKRLLVGIPEDKLAAKIKERILKCSD